MAEEEVQHRPSRRDILKWIGCTFVGAVLISIAGSSHQGETIQLPSESRIPVDGFIGNMPLVPIIEKVKGILKPIRVFYINYINKKAEEHEYKTTNVVINPEGIKFYRFIRKEIRALFGFGIREDDDVFVAIAEPQCDFTPVFLEKVFFGLKIRGSNMVFYKVTWEEEQGINTLPHEIIGIKKIIDALKEGKTVYFCNFGSKNKSKIPNMIVAGIRKPDQPIQRRK